MKVHTASRGDARVTGGGDGMVAIVPVVVVAAAACCTRQSFAWSTELADAAGAPESEAGAWGGAQLDTGHRLKEVVMVKAA